MIEISKKYILNSCTARIGRETSFESHTMTFTGMRQSNEGPKSRRVERDSCM